MLAAGFDELNVGRQGMAEHSEAIPVVSRFQLPEVKKYLRRVLMNLLSAGRD
jgi:hypothetical protein